MHDENFGEVAMALSRIFPNSRVREFRRGSAGLYSLFKTIRDLHGAGEIIVPNLCCETVALAALFAGHQVRFADVDDQRFCVTPRTIQNAMGPLTRAVVVAHLFGLTVDASAFDELRTSNPGVIFIEDVAHAAGGRASNGCEVGSGFDHAMFSFSPTKILGGEGGAVISYRSDEVTTRFHDSQSATVDAEIDPLLALSLRNSVHAVADLHRAGSLGAAADISPAFWERFRPLVASDGPFKIGQRAVTDLKNRFDIQAQRVSRVAQYRRAIQHNGFTLVEFSEVETCWRFPILAESPTLRRRATDALRREGLNASNHYFPLNRLFCEDALCASESIGDRIINLWVDDSVSDMEISKTVKIINAL